MSLSRSARRGIAAFARIQQSPSRVKYVVSENVMVHMEALRAEAVRNAVLAARRPYGGDDAEIKVGGF